jgi:para-nitrobenzyl esterase
LLDRCAFGPVVDGDDLPQHPADPEAPAIADDIPLMVGGAREESAFFLADDDQVWNGTLTEADLRSGLRRSPEREPTPYLASIGGQCRRQARPTG